MVGTDIVWCGHRDSYTHSMAVQVRLLKENAEVSHSSVCNWCSSWLTMCQSPFHGPSERARWKHTVVASLSISSHSSQCLPPLFESPGPFPCWTPWLLCFPAGLFPTLTHSLVQIMASVIREVSSGYLPCNTALYFYWWFYLILLLFLNQFHNHMFSHCEYLPWVLYFVNEFNPFKNRKEKGTIIYHLFIFWAPFLRYFVQIIFMINVVP